MAGGSRLAAAAIGEPALLGSSRSAAIRLAVGLCSAFALVTLVEAIHQPMLRLTLAALLLTAVFTVRLCRRLRPNATSPAAPAHRSAAAAGGSHQPSSAPCDARDEPGGQHRDYRQERSITNGRRRLDGAALDGHVCAGASTRSASRRRNRAAPLPVPPHLETCPAQTRPGAPASWPKQRPVITPRAARSDRRSQRHDASQQRHPWIPQ